MSTVDLHFLVELTAYTDFVAYFQFLTSIKWFDAKPDKIGYKYIIVRKNVIDPVHCKELFLKLSVASLPDYRGSSNTNVVVPTTLLWQNKISMWNDTYIAI